MNVLFSIVGTLIFLVVVLVVIASQKPDAFRYSRTIVISAAAAKVFPFVVDFREWAAWSPYERLDGAMKKAYEGVSGTVGASYTWSGNDKVGEGTMTVARIEEDKKIDVNLEFRRPFTANNLAEFVFDECDGSTTVTWSMSGKYPLMMKVVGIFMNMDKMVGADFERGLASLKELVEAKS